MAIEITMPQLSDTMTEGVLVKWLKKEGDAVKEGEIIAEIETDKATMEYESPEAGTLAVLAAKEGERVAVGKPIAVIAGSGEDAKQVKSQFGAGGGSAAGPDKETDHAKMDEERTEARRDEVEAGTHASEPGLKVEEAPATGGRVKASPLAKRIAEQNGVDLSRLRGSGPGGRIIQKDVEEFIAGGDGGARAAAQPPARIAPPAQPLQPAAVPVLAARVGTGRQEVVPLTKMRGVIAQRLQQAKQQIPHFYETVDIDMEHSVQLRQRLNAQLEGQDIRLSVNDLIIKAVAMALIENPSLNATFDGQQITRWGDVNLGLAVAIPDGLIVPVLRNVDQMNLREIRIRTGDLYERARAQRLKREELSGATFTISTLGSMGVREFSAIINPPEVGILAVGAAEKRAVVHGDQLAARMMMSVTLSCDHRAVDGATAAGFLRTLKQLLEEPGLMLA